VIVTLIVLAVMAATAVGLWRLLRHQTPHPTEPSRTVDYGQLRAMWPPDGGFE
jgi:hypothetical protein